MLSVYGIGNFNKKNWIYSQKKFANMFSRCFTKMWENNKIIWLIVMFMIDIKNNQCINARFDAITAIIAVLCVISQNRL